MRTSKSRSAAAGLAGFLLAVGTPTAGLDAAPMGAPGVQTGAKSGLPVPRFVSLKAGRTNVRVGPGEDYKIAWVFTRPGLPIEVIQEYDTWRRIRDSDGTVGWVFQSLLSGKRTVVVSPWESGAPLPIYSGASPKATIVAYLQHGVTGTVDRCRDNWCRVSGTGYSGWMPEGQLWGVYQNEEIN
jgi:SH3-like domain-containing protein